MNILDKFLKARGLKSPDELDNTPNSDGSPTEKQTFEKWRKVLSQGEVLTVEQIKEFCQSQVAIIEMKWKDMTVDNIKKAEMIPYHTIYKTLEQAMSAPKAEREQLEATLNQLI